MDNLSTSQFVKRGEIQINDQYLVIADPCYLNTEHETLLWVRNWFKQTANCFIVDDGDDRARAMVVTLCDAPPVELLQPRLSGTFAYVDLCGVDSGMIAIAHGEYTGRRRATWKPKIYKNTLFVENTYQGDGQHPIAVWADNGLIHTVAIITDWSYYPEGQFFWAGYR